MASTRPSARTSDGKTILILGGGVGGLSTANALRALVGREHRVVLVDKHGEHLFSPSLLWLMVGVRRREQLTGDLRTMVRPGTRVIRAEVREIDPEHNRVAAGGHDLAYDALVVAHGADLAPDALPGYAAGAHNFFDLDGAIRLRDALRDSPGGRVVVAVSALPFKCPAAPYEAALLIEDALRKRNVRARSEVMIYTPEPQPMPVAGLLLGGALSALLEQRGISFYPNHSLRAIDPERNELVITDDTRVGFDLLAATPPHKPPPVVAASPLADERGWIPVDKHTLQSSFENVYAIGDVASITLTNGKPLPKAGVFAHAEGLTVAQTLALSLDGGGPAAEFDGAGYCWVEMGAGKATFASGDFYAEPDPDIQLRSPGRSWHLGKILFERYWMGAGLRQAAARWGLAAGGKMLGIPNVD